MDGLACALTAAIGLAVGVSEILNRYQDEPFKVLKTFPALAYVLVNALAAILALVFVDAFQWIDNTGDIRSFLTRVFASGLGAMAIFRSALLTVRIGQRDVGIGMQALLTMFLESVDRAVDRGRAVERAKFVLMLMKDIDFDKAYAILPAFCIESLQGLSAEAQQELIIKIKALKEDTGNNTEIKSALLGLTLLNVVGEAVLRTAVDQLRDRISLHEPGKA